MQTEFLAYGAGQKSYRGADCLADWPKNTGLKIS